MWSCPHCLRNRRATLLALPLLIALVGCHQEQAAWDRAEAVGTFSSYRQYVSTHPDGSHIGLAERRIDSLLFAAARRIHTVYAYSHFLERVPDTRYRDAAQEAIQDLRSGWPAALADVDTIAVELHTSFPEGYKVPAEWLLDEIRSLFWLTSLTAVDGDSHEADARLVVTVRGEPVTAYYMPGGRRHAGAVVSGEVVFRANGRAVARDSFYQRESPPTKIADGEYENPDDAPFNRSYDDLLRQIAQQLQRMCKLPHQPTAQIRMENSEITLVDDGRVFAEASGRGRVEVFSAVDGDLLHTLEMPEGSLKAAEDSVYVVAVHFSDVRGLDSETGAVLWETQNLDPLGLLEARDGTVYLTTKRRRLVALDVSTGVSRWSVPFDGRPSWTTLESGDDETVVFYTGAKLYGVDVEDGMEAWTFEVEEGGDLTAAGSTVYVGDGESLRAIETDLHEVLWTYDFPSRVRGKPLVSDDVVIVSGRGGTYGVDRVAGHLLWRFDLESGQSVTDGSTVYVVMDGNRGSGASVFALDVETGTVQWKFWIEGSPGVELLRPSFVVVFNDERAYTFDVSS